MSRKGLPNSSTYTSTYTSTVTGSSPMAGCAPKARRSLVINDSLINFKLQSATREGI